MSKKNKNSVSVTFVSEVESINDTSQVKAAYKDLVKQITSFAESVTADPNIIISHSTINMAGQTPSLKDPASPKMAELQTIGARIEQGKSSISNPGYNSKFEAKLKKEEMEEDTKVEENDPYDPPRVKAGPWTPPLKNTPAGSEESSVVVTPADSGLKDSLVKAIFVKLKATSNSKAIVNFFAENPDKELSIDDIAKGSKLEKLTVNAWLSQTMKQIASIHRTDKRGRYIMDSAKVKI